MKTDQQSALRRWIIPGAVLLAATGLAAAWLIGSPDGKALQEQISGETPRAKIGAYVQTILHKDKAAALSLWELPQLTNQGQLKALDDRRVAMTDRLIAADFQPDFTILSIEWWGTCCEPRVIDTPRDAGGARVRAQFLDKSGAPFSLMFDVFTRGSYWGAAEGYPLRQWVIRDIYPDDQEPLFWRLVYRPTVDYLPFGETITPAP